MKRYFIHQWPYIAVFVLAWLVSAFCEFGLQWSQWIAVLIGLIVGLPMCVGFLLWQDRMQLRAKTFEQIRLHPDADTFDFEHDGKIYHATIKKLRPDNDI